MSDLVRNLLSSTNHAKCMSFTNQKCMAQPTINNLYPNEYTQGLHYYPFVVNLDRCVRKCNTLNGWCNKLCVPHKTEDLNLIVFDITAGINQSKALTMHISCKCKCEFDGRKCNSNQNWNNNKC